MYHFVFAKIEHFKLTLYITRPYSEPQGQHMPSRHGGVTILTFPLIVVLPQSDRVLALRSVHIFFSHVMFSTRHAISNVPIILVHHNETDARFSFDVVMDLNGSYVYSGIECVSCFRVTLPRISGVYGERNKLVFYSYFH